jgi:hypothetical protein
MKYFLVYRMTVTLCFLAIKCKMLENVAVHTVHIPNDVEPKGYRKLQTTLCFKFSKVLF